MTTVTNTVESFLLSHYDSARPVLLGLSGGPDSLALLKILLEFRSRHPLQLIAVHCDHQWRSSSKEEAQKVAALCQQHDVTCELCQLPPPLPGNWEGQGREERLKAFRRISEKYDAQAVLLGHHGNDRAESVLKAVCEGKTLTSLRSISEISHVNEIALWRPLLSFTKEQVTEVGQPWLMDPIEDSSNHDSRFLRARMRQSILPTLAEEFGKSITQPLLRVADEASGLEEYLDGKISDLLAGVLYGPWGAAVPLDERNLHHVEVRHLLRRIMEALGMAPDHASLTRLQQLTLNGSNGDKVATAGVHAERGKKHLFLFSRAHVPVSEETLQLTPGVHAMGEWEVEVEEVTEPLEALPNWHSLWTGEARFTLPPGTYQLRSRVGCTTPNGVRSMGRWWNNHSVPNWIRDLVPVVVAEGKVVHELLSGRPLSLALTESVGWHITLRLQKRENPVGIIRSIASMVD